MLKIKNIEKSYHGKLKIKNIEKSYHGKKILDDVSFDVRPGQIVVLLGSSGVGKSTVLRVLNDLETVDAGSLELDGKTLDFKKVGMVFQDFNLFNHLTVEENIILPQVKVALKTKEQAQKVAHELLEQFGLTAKAQVYPASLSGGQKQRVALARTLAMNPAVLCLDEPSSALDPVLKAELAGIITGLAKQGYMMVIATHDVGLLLQLDCTVHLMKQGKIIESITTGELCDSNDSCQNIKNFIKGKIAV